MINPDSIHKRAIFGRYHAGETVRTERFQYSEWANGDRMLYDHERDPNEDVNVAEDPKYKKVATAMSTLLEKHRTKLAFDDNSDLKALDRPENYAPVWNRSSFNQNQTRQPLATVGEEYISHVNWRVKDNEGDPLVFAKVSGPDWLVMSNSQYGRLKGIPKKSDRGTNVFVISVTDGFNPPVLAEMTLEVE